MPVNSTDVNQPWKTGSNFTFMLLPVDHRLPDPVLKSVKHPQGHIDLSIRDLRDEPLGIMKQNGFLCHFIVTDGDNGVEGSYKAAFEKYAGLGETDIRAILAVLTNDGTEDLEHWPTSNSLHLLKMPALAKLSERSRSMGRPMTLLRQIC
jgi:hypothetical protein